MEFHRHRQILLVLVLGTLTYGGREKRTGQQIPDWCQCQGCEAGNNYPVGSRDWCRCCDQQAQAECQSDYSVVEECWNNSYTLDGCMDQGYGWQVCQHYTIAPTSLLAPTPAPAPAPSHGVTTSTSTTADKKVSSTNATLNITVTMATSSLIEANTSMLMTTSPPPSITENTGMRVMEGRATSTNAVAITNGTIIGIAMTIMAIPLVLLILVILLYNIWGYCQRRRTARQTDNGLETPLVNV